MEKYIVFLAPTILFTFAFALLLIGTVKAKHNKTKKDKCTDSTAGEVVAIFKHKSKGYTPCYIYQGKGKTFFCHPFGFDPKFTPLAYRKAACDTALWTSRIYLDSSHIVSKAKYGWHSNYAVGSKIQIKYDPEDPKLHYILSEDSMSFTTSGIKITGIALLAMGVLALMIAILGVMGIMPQR